MSIDCARAVLRLIAVTSILIGAAMTTMAIIGVIAWGQTSLSVGGHEWSGASMDVYSVAAQVSIIAWGIVLFIASPRLAELVTK